MGTFLDIGELIFNTLLAIGDFLVVKPFASLVRESNIPVVGDWLTWYSQFLGNMTLAEMIIGTGLTFVLVYKACKFIRGLF